MCRGLACAILTAFNIVLLVAGFVLLIFGALLKWNKPLLQTLLQKGFDKAGGSLDETSKDALDSALDRIKEMADPIGTVLFILGIVIVLIAIIAFIGICCRIRIILIIYAILIGAVFLAHLLLVIIYFANRQVLLKYVDKGMIKLINEYVSIQSQEPASIALAFIMPSLQCCGYNNGEDFKSNTSRFSKEDFYHSQNFTNLSYPLPCCNPRRIGPNNNDCPKTFNNETSFVEVGCKERVVPIVDTIMKYSLIALVIEAAVFVAVVINLSCSK